MPDDNRRPGSADHLTHAVGPRLRSLRRERGATLAELSERTGISVSTLSRLESGRRKPTLELLLPLARVHQVRLDDLVGGPGAGDPRIAARPFVRNGSTFLPLTRRAGGIQAFKQIIPPRWPPGDPDPRSHDGHDWFYVLSGRLRLVLGDHDLVMKPGEAAEFDCRTPHWFANPGEVPTEVLCLFGPQGERLHVRASQRRR